MINIVKNLNLHINEGELVSLIGVSGSENNYFQRHHFPSKINTGEILLNNESIVNKTGKVSYMLQKDLLLPLQNHSRQRFFALDNQRREEKKTPEKRPVNILKNSGLRVTQDKHPSALSGGMRQRAALLRTYMFSHDVALLDEPFSALDAITKRNFHKWYLDIIKKIKLSTLLITHDIDEAILLSDRIYILAEVLENNKGI